MIGKTVSHYKILGKLGEGGMGVVYHAQDLTLKREVALKFLPFHSLHDTEQRTRLVREAQAAAALEHININTVYEIADVEDQTFMAMAYVAGKDLRQLIKEGPQPLETVLSIAIQIASGLAQAHAHDIVHRDVKPANVLITQEGIVKLVDFGLAKLAGATGITKSDSTMGTAAYMSPEQAQGQVVDHRTDIWSLGVIIYEMLTGRRPFRGEHEAVTMYSIVTEDFEPLSDLRSDVPPELERIVGRALAKKPADRFATMTEMLGALRGMLDETPADVSGPQSTRLKVTKRPFYQQRSVQIGGVAIFIIAALAVLYFATKPPDQKKPVFASDTTADTAAEVEIPYALTPLDYILPDSVWEAESTATAMAVADSAAADSSSDSVSVQRIPSVAVLYLEDRSDDDDGGYFAAGMTEEIIADLFEIDSLRTFSPDQMKPYRGRSAKIQDAGPVLGADYVLEGSVQRDREQLLVNVRLVRVDDAQLVWSDHYDRTPADVFSIQAEIVAGVAKAVGARYSLEEWDRLVQEPTKDLEAYDYYLRARAVERRYLEDNNKEAERLLQKALKRDNQFMLAMIDLADVYLTRVRWGIDFNSEWVEKAADLLDRVTAIDSTPAALHHVQVHRYLMTGQYVKALVAAQRAADKHPDDYEAQYDLGVALHFNNQRREAKKTLDRARELNPTCAEALIGLAAMAHEEGRTTRAGELIQAALEAAPKSATILAAAGRYYLTRGRFTEAIHSLEKATIAEPESPIFTGQLGEARLLFGNEPSANDLLDEAADRTKLPCFYWYLGWAHMLNGDERDAKRAFEKSYEADQVRLTINPADLEAAYRSQWARCYFEKNIGTIQTEVDRLGTSNLVSTNPSLKRLYLAGIYEATGNRTRALEELQQIIKQNYFDSKYFAAHPGFASMKRLTEFRELVGLE
jgi:serine/threonine protein kinase/TolB-like protein/tetratricopeptide (TPR) repeat protein